MEQMLSFRRSPALRLVVLFTLFFFCLLITGGIGTALDHFSGMTERTVYLCGALVQGVLAFCVPAWLTARYSTDHPWHFLGLTERVGLRPFIGVLIVYVVALPAMNQLIVWNESIQFPEWASAIEKKLRDLEEAGSSATGKMLEMATWWDFVSTILIVGVVTGFSEELFFRGALQNIFIKSKVQTFVTVWTTALIFSTMHFQFFGFVPRVLMGAFFGYVFLWCGSLWPSIFAHALNNSLVVAGVWISGNSQDGLIENFGIAQGYSFPLAAMCSLIATVLFFWKFRIYFFKNNAVNGKEIKRTIFP